MGEDLLEYKKLEAFLEKLEEKKKELGEIIARVSLLDTATEKERRIKLKALDILNEWLGVINQLGDSLFKEQAKLVQKMKI
ncbi:MAG: hypothetical protein J7K73_01560 [Nanoarchaeota archaeon]|nr:hypothetical protein [Nanoarchaeota archaeon]